MAQEQKRGCGYRKVGGIYLVSDGLWADCDRLPLAVGCCPTCHGGIKYPRAPLEIDPMTLFGNHDGCIEGVPDGSPAGVRYTKNCHVCFPQHEVAYLLGVGEQFYNTTEDFTAEAMKLGVSKRISQIPKKLEVGKTWIYLVHRKAMLVADQDTGERKAQMAVFAAFRPRRIEKILSARDHHCHLQGRRP